MSRRRGGLWRRTLWGGSEGGGLDPAEALLNEAAVRFDFSQYSDINNMVDVNGGWGPLDVTIDPEASVVLVDGGLRVVTTDGYGGVSLGMTPGSSGPFMFSNQGFSYLGVIELIVRDGDFDSTGRRIVNIHLVADGGGDFAPEFQLRLDLQDPELVDPPDRFRLYVSDLAPDYDTIIDWGDATDYASWDDPPGVFIGIGVVSPLNQSGTVTMISPSGHRFDIELPFEKHPPDFATGEPVAADYIELSHPFESGPHEFVRIEDVAWNRALTPAEVDTLITHFTA